ncbi:MAG: hypothetical protein COV47_06240 [Candidatus Diapherotrites archaeon CG11_big_fil_rev_8_21_14_0_20_37_9]|nr:MAG: hypothetical protein COV47_06240 [Candidatus Diapherotrites archaeon CG11_big_fil_rev_8_21_14_0_20_37_9]
MEQSSKVAFDTNMLLNIARFNIDVFEETGKLLGKAEFVVPRQVIQELDKLSHNGPKTRKEANVAKILIEKRHVKIVENAEKGADEALRKMAPETIIATNDKELKNSVKKLNGKVLYLRQKKKLEIC